MPETTKPRPLGTSAASDNKTSPAPTIPAMAERGAARRRCAHLFPALTGCRDDAEPGSKFCAQHGGDA